MRKFIKNQKSQEGSNNIIEFGYILPIVLVLLIGVLQFGIYLYGMSIVENAARDAARAGSVAQDCPACSAEATAYNALDGAPVITDYEVTILAPGGVVGSTIRVRITARIPMLVPGGEALGLGPLMEVSAEATFRQEGW